MITLVLVGTDTTVVLAGMWGPLTIKPGAMPFVLPTVSVVLLLTMVQVVVMAYGERVNIPEPFFTKTWRPSEIELVK